MTNMSFTERERACGNAIFFSANRLQYASNATKLSVSTQLFDRALLNRNGVMDIWNMAHVEDGEKYYIRKEYTEVSELHKGSEQPVIIQQVPQQTEPAAGEEPQNGQEGIVGNRPLPLYEAELLTSDAYIERFMAPAGLTGLWQVEKRGGAGKMSAEERKQLDIKYAQEFSFWLDMKILCKTLTAFVQKENV
mgnify:CR=1 FL=1